MNSLGVTAAGGNSVPVREAAWTGLFILLLLAGSAVMLQHMVALPARFVPTVVGAFVLLLIVLLLLLAHHYPRQRFGAANRITLGRVAIGSLLLGCIGAGAHPMLAWCVVGLATVAACSDALDGLVARRYGTVSAFGARFDMEADAGLILILSLLTWQFEKAGAWVVAIGLMRYAFVLAGISLPWLRASLPPRVRRQSVCVVQMVALILCLAPLVPRAWSTALAAFSLLALGISFLIDIAWLAREGRRAR